jgi:DNA polymerase III subunit epsilon
VDGRETIVTKINSNHNEARYIVVSGFLFLKVFFFFQLRYFSSPLFYPYKHMYLFFDTETTGLPVNWKAPVSDLSNWPRLIQLGCLLFDEHGCSVASLNELVQPEGFIIPADAAAIHGITTDLATKKGSSLESVLRRFTELASEAKVLVAHNMSYDEKIIGAEFLRKGWLNIIDTKQRFCTMQSSTAYCNIPGRYGPKWPSLEELHYKLFEEGFDDAHDAMVDISITAKCFWELKHRGVI